MRGEALREFLAGARRETVALDDLVRVWRHAEIALEGPAPENLVPGEHLPGLVHAALMREADRVASPEALKGRPCPREPACLFDLLHNDHGHGIGRPFAIAVFVGAERFAVRLVLAGLAARWAEAAARTLELALREGIAADISLVADGASRFRPSAAWPAWPAAPRGAGVKFLTRFHLGKSARRLPAGDDGSPTADHVLVELWNRARALSAWQGVGLQAEMPPALAAAWHRARGRARFTPTRRHFSSRNAAEDAWFGTLDLDGDPGPAAALLALGELFHVGRHAALVGAGRYRIDWRTGDDRR